MTVQIPSFAKINLGLYIGSMRSDRFHELRTVYQTIALHDVIRVSVEPGSGIEIRCDDPRVPTGSTNTCSRTVERAIVALKARRRVLVQIEKRLPVQGGLGGASGNAVATLLALERALGKELSFPERLRIAAEVGSDLPLFLIGGSVLGAGHGEEVYPLPDLPAMPCVIALPEVAVSTPKAFLDWDQLNAPPDLPDEDTNGKGTTFNGAQTGFLNEAALAAGGSSAKGKKQGARLGDHSQARHATSLGVSDLSKLKNPEPSDRMSEFSREISSWLSAASERSGRTAGVSSGAGGRAESPLLDLVRTGIENDFEKVVFPQYPELRKVKSVLERAGAKYASLSGSGSAIYGLFDSREQAVTAARKLERSGKRAVVTSTLTRRQYWKQLRAVSN